MKLRKACAPSGFGIDRDCHHVEPHECPFDGRVVDDLDPVIGLFRPVAGLKDIPRPAECDADIAIGKRVDVFRVVEVQHIGTDRSIDILDLRDHVRIMAVRVLAQPGQRRRDHFRRGIQQMHPAFRQGFHVLRVEEQVQRVDRRILSEDLAHPVHVDAKTGRAPHVVDGIAVAGVILCRSLRNHVPHVLGIGQQVIVQRLERPGRDLTLQERARRHHEVIAGSAGQHPGFQQLVGIEHVVDEIVACLFLELRQQRLVDVVGPVVDPHLLG